MKIVIVDDDFLVSQSLKIILETQADMEVAAVGANGREAISLYGAYHPDVLLMDIRMKEMDGLTASQEILNRWPDAKILLLTTFSDDEYIIRALKIGAKGYLLKQDYESIYPALHSVVNGQTVFGHEVMQKLPNLLEHKEKFSCEEYGISQREADIIRAVGEGFCNREIAEKLFLSEGTVRNYLSQILDKLELRDRTQLAVFCYKKGLIS